VDALSTLLRIPLVVEESMLCIDFVFARRTSGSNSSSSGWMVCHDDSGHIYEVLFVSLNLISIQRRSYTPGCGPILLGLQSPSP
jgi:hypothetical protein